MSGDMRLNTVEHPSWLIRKKWEDSGGGVGEVARWRGGEGWWWACEPVQGSFIIPSGEFCPPRVIKTGHCR